MRNVTRTVELDSGHEISVNLCHNGYWSIVSIDLETSPYRELESVDGGPFLSESEALEAARVVAAKALR